MDGATIRAQSPATSTRLRAIAGGTIGNLVEWFDFYVYSAFSLYFAHVFFPKGDSTAQLLNTAAVFAIGFVMRPVGGWLLGVYADRKGRKAALTLSVLLMCGGSGLIAVTPGFDRIGVAAPILLVVARLLQGLSVGGEYGASATYLSEMSGETNRGFLASFQYVTLIGGQLLALAVLLILQATLSEGDLHAWGWRIPFVIGAVLAVVALWLRTSLTETAAFADTVPAARRNPFGQLAAFRGRVALVVMLGAGGSLAFYTFTTYMQKFLVNTLHWTKPDASFVAFATL
ncbi:MAG: MFS transporter, partial [Sphingomonadaceae bacterium]|nr:MFS transporter [Sphingomonadaceae bacterium]